MTERNSVRGAIRVGSMCAIFAGLVLTLLSAETQAGPASSTPPIQTGAGGTLNPDLSLPSGGNTITTVRVGDFVENYTEEVLRQIAQGLIKPPSGRELESIELHRGLYGEGADRASTVAVLGDPNIGKTTTMIQYVLDHPSEIVYRIKTEALAQIQSKDGNPALDKAARKVALRSILDYMVSISKGNSVNDSVVFIQNFNPLMEGGLAEIKPGAAVMEAVNEKLQLRLVLETDAGTYKKMTTDSPTFGKLTTAQEIGSPRQDSVLDYLRTNRGLIESRAKVNLSEPALAEAAKLALRHFATDPFSKAFQILAHAADTLSRDQNAGATETARTQAQMTRVQLEIDSIQKDLVVQPSDQLSQRLALLTQQIDTLEKKKEGLLIRDAGSSEEIASLGREITALNKQLDEKPGSWFNSRERDRLNTEIATKTKRRLELMRLQNQAVDPSGKPANQVGPKQVQLAAAEFAGMDPAVIALDVRESAQRLDEINKELFNMNHLVQRAKQRIATAVEEMKLLEEQALANPQQKPPSRRKPIWSVMIPGRTGTGKSDFAYKLSEKTGMPLIKIHMSTYGQAHHASGLIGARPEYVGFGQEGELTGPVRKTPYIIIMLDEIQRANIEVIKTIVYPILDQGEIKDSEGRTVYFDHAIIIAPTNAGEKATIMSRDELLKFVNDNSVKKFPPAELAAMSQDELVAEAVRIDLRTEFHWEESMVGRWDDIIPSRPLTPKVVEEIAHKNMRLFAKDLAWRQIKAKVTQSAMDAVIASFDETQGARSIEAFFKRNIKDPIYLGFGTNLNPGQSVVVDYTNGGFTLTVVTPERLASAEAAGRVEEGAESERIRTELARDGRALTPETHPEMFRMFSDEFMVRNATAKILRRMGKE